VGIPPQEDAWLGKATERIFLAPIKMTMVPEITDMDMPIEGVFHNLVITKIKKEYAGQGQKVMNAMWGAGQMMFNKILVMADEGVSIQDYQALAKYVFKNLNPATDIFFSTGPMDVLDHSCSKLGFGGKMCIDGTSKCEEETDEQYQPVAITENDIQFIQGLAKLYPEVHSINTSLLLQDIPCIVIAVQKNRPGHISALHTQVCAHLAMATVKMILYVEHTINALDLPTALWRFCNNLDPKRDFHLYKTTSNPYTSCMGLDGTMKTKELDGFMRNWPNIIVANDATIKAVDDKWSTLGIGEFIASPSLKFKSQMYGEEAVAN
jgi:4-hydroxy-3-polyprenylbenzoate decarboxylase